MKLTISVLNLAGIALALLVACSSKSSTAGTATSADASPEFTVEGCKADTCGAEAKICGWGNNDAKYGGCLTDCVVLGTISELCPKQAAALYTCANLGSKVDCTTGKGTGCDAEEQRLATCAQADGGS